MRVDLSDEFYIPEPCVLAWVRASFQERPRKRLGLGFGKRSFE